MTLPNSSGNNGLGRSVGDAAGRGAVLVGIAVLIGIFLLWAGFDASSGDSDDAAATDSSADDGGSDAAADAGSDSETDAGADAGSDSETDSGTGTTDGGGTDAVDGTTPPTVAPPGTAHPPNEVVVFVANGTGIGGEAGRVADRLTAANYTAIAGNAANAAVENSKIYYRPDYGEDAKLVAGVLQAPDSLIQQMPEDPGVSPDNQADADGANIIIILGTDGLITG